VFQPNTYTPENPGHPKISKNFPQMNVNQKKKKKKKKKKKINNFNFPLPFEQVFANQAKRRGSELRGRRGSSSFTCSEEA
jgi:hypothetical protein